MNTNIHIKMATGNESLRKFVNCHSPCIIIVLLLSILSGGNNIRGNLCFRVVLSVVLVNH